MAETEEVLYTVASGIATITLNRPDQRNALNVAVNRRLSALWEEVDRNPDVRVVILTAAPCGTFCAGMDLKEAARIRSETGEDVLKQLEDPFHSRLRNVRKPVVGALTGNLMAGGMMLALNCDIRVGLAGSRVGITEARVGRGSPWAMPLLWMLPEPLLKEMTLTAQLLPAERFHDLGFLNYLEPNTERVQVRSRILAEAIRDNAPLSVAAAKTSISRAMDLGCAQGLLAAEAAHRVVYGSEDAQEGPRAFAEKRAPNWSGR